MEPSSSDTRRTAMFNLVLEAGPQIHVQSARHTYRYANDGSLPNPLESMYATLAGCAGVYAKKACRELGLDDTGIAISMRVIAKAGQPLVPARFVTTVEFPERFDEAQQSAILQAIEKCAVKAVIQQGATIEFLVEGRVPA